MDPVKVKAARKAKGLKQIEVAKAAGMSQQAYARLEKVIPVGEDPLDPRLSTLERVAVVLGVPFHELCTAPSRKPRTPKADQ